MRNLLATAALCTTLGLGGCITSDEINQYVGQVQSLTQTVCQYVPEATTVAAIIGSLIAGGTAVTNVIDATATGICNAVAPPAASGRLRVTATPTFAGVVIKGHFVTK